MRYLAFAILIFCCSHPAVAQVMTRAQLLIATGEDSLQAGYNSPSTVISGYGSAYYQRDFNARKGTATLERAVLFVGHQFNKKWSFFSELEVEDAKVAGGEFGGEIAMEQAYIRYNLNPGQYLVAGLFIPRIGLINENHLPVNFNGVERPLVETYVIPATWRELGIGWYGTFNRLQLNAGLLNGLNAVRFEHGSGFREGRAEGALATANNIGVTAAVVYSLSPFRFQISGYAGGTNGLTPRASDSLGLDGGAFGLPLYLGEADIKFEQNGLSAKALGAVVSYPDAGKVNAAFGENNATRMFGAYAELGFDLLHDHSASTGGKAQLIAFARMEYMDLNSKIPAPPKAIDDPTLAQSNLIAGLNFLPIPNVTLKADVRLQHTGDQNPDLLINPAPNALPYRPHNTFLNIGVGYSF